jgi:N-acetylneuraminic acid mutarotase
MWSLAVNPLPKPIAFGTAVPYGRSFLLVGGVIKENKVVTDLSTIYRYNPEEDSWTLLDSRMKEGKRSVIAVLIDRDVLEAE